MNDVTSSSKTIDTVIKDLVSHGKASGHVSTGEILEAMGEMDFNPDEIEKLYDSMESMGVEIVEGLDEPAEQGHAKHEEVAIPTGEISTTDDPVKVYLKEIGNVPLLSAEAQHKCGGFDHAGKFESSLMYALYPNHVDLERTKDNTEWFALNSVETSMELGQHMVQCALETLDKIIV